MEKDLILIVEDNESILFNLNLMLKLNNYDVLTASNGKIALDVLDRSSKRPDLILSDILMPEMDGYEFFKEVSNNSLYNMIPFIFLSAKASSEEIKIGKILGADDYVTKPIDEDFLLSIIKNKIHKVRNLELELLNILNSKLFLKTKEFIGVTKGFEDNNLIYLGIIEQYNSHHRKTFKRIKGIEIQELDELVLEIFQSSKSMFNDKVFTSPDSILLDIDAINLKALLVFDVLEDSQKLNKTNLVMICIIAPKITYFEKVHLSNTIQSMVADLKQGELINIEYYYDTIQTMLVQTAL